MNKKRQTRSTCLVEMKTLQALLGYFDPNAHLVELRLGDTGHPASGFVTETDLGLTNPTVLEMTSMRPTLTSLVEFKALIDGLNVELVNSEPLEFRIVGPSWRLRNLSARFRAARVRLQVLGDLGDES